jgi:protein involved in polysaccharide export with SLBB domain
VYGAGIGQRQSFQRSFSAIIFCVTVVTGNLQALQFLEQSIRVPLRKRKDVLQTGLRLATDLSSKSLVHRGLTQFITVFLFISPFYYALLAQDHTKVKAADAPVVQQSLVHYGDLIDVDVVGGFEFDWRGTITPEGTLDGITTFDEPIFALCRTENEIARDIGKAYSKILRDPKVEVRIIDRSNRAVARVEGAIRTPTRFSIRREARLGELLVLAGGIINGASGEITILRPENLSCDRQENSANPRPTNPTQTLNIKIKDLISGKASANPVILSGDVVTVSRALPVYVIGAVNNPGAVYMTADLTLSRAITTAGGLTKEAEANSVTIFRQTSSGSTTLRTDLARIKLGELEDEYLRSFDIIDIPTRGGPKRAFPPAAPAVTAKNSNWVQLPLKIVD